MTARILTSEGIRRFRIGQYRKSRMTKLRSSSPARLFLRLFVVVCSDSVTGLNLVF